MSTLTKIFVVLHVVVSLLLASALVVFVNRQENFKATAAAAKQDAAQATALASLKAQEVAKIQGQKIAVVQEKEAQIAVLQNDVRTAQGTAGTKDEEVARLNSSITQLNTSLTSANAALAVAQGELKASHDAYASLRDEKDRDQKQLVDSNVRVTELTSQLDVTTRQNRFMAEQVTQLQTDNARQGELLRKYNISPTIAPAGGALNKTPSVNINGIVRETRKINGVPFATISLGSADAVTKGMQFNVINPGGSWLGYLIVDSVNFHDATGRLEGPGVQQVKINISEVRTQLN